MRDSIPVEIRFRKGLSSSVPVASFESLTRPDVPETRPQHTWLRLRKGILLIDSVVFNRVFVYFYAQSRSVRDADITVFHCEEGVAFDQGVQGDQASSGSTGGVVNTSSCIRQVRMVAAI